MSQWTVYILRCADDSLYTGITTDIERRLQEHNNGNRGAAYTRGRRPVMLAYQKAANDRAEATRHEYQIKQLSRSAKEQLIGTGVPGTHDPKRNVQSGSVKTKKGAEPIAKPSQSG